MAKLNYFNCLFIFSILFQVTFLQENRYFRRAQITLVRYLQQKYFYEGSSECCSSDPRCNNPCPVRMTVDVQGNQIYNRGLLVPTNPTGDYGMDAVFTEESREKFVFETRLTYNFRVWSTEANFRSIASIDIVGSSMAPNSDFLYDQVKLGEHAQGSIYIAYHCYGYTGYNCHFFCPMDEPNVECDFFTGEVVCNNGAFDPPSCTKMSDSCLIDPCLNGGKCRSIDHRTNICDCPLGFTGINCQFPECRIPCDIENGVCLGTRCVCNPGFGGSSCELSVCNDPSFCQNNANCAIVLGSRVCDCDSSRFTGERCEIECNPTCVFGRCTTLGSTIICQCDDGYSGTRCTELIPTLPPIFESGYLPTFQQRTFVGVTVLVVIVVGLVSFGVAFYFRRIRGFKGKIMEKSQSAVNTLIQNTLRNN